MSYYDRDVNEITREAWIALVEQPEYKRVGLTKVGEAEVSTVWLGIDHAVGSRWPVIFETLVFDGPMDGDGERYNTLAEAEAGHARWVEQVRTGAVSS